MTYRIILVALATSVAALAQVSATVVPGAPGRSRIVINNQSDIPLEAFEVTWVAPRGPHFSNTGTSVTYVDDLLRANPKRANQASIAIQGDLDTPVQLRAAIFKDGSTYGDPAWVAILLKRREQYDASLDAFLKELQTATQESLSREVLVERLEALRNSQLAALPAATGPGADLNVPALVAAAQREGVELVSHFVIANFQKLPARRRNGTASTISYHETLAFMTEMLHNRRSSFPGAPGN